MAKIHVLDPAVADKIAAGEVVERPVSVVKELLENALDANSHTIRLDIFDGGLREIRITDDGDGIEKEDLPLAFVRHATSKIASFDDLFTLHSFGFRGEALASIATVSQIEVISGVENQETFQYNPASQALHQTSPYKGTIISVKNLFYNVPARKKFMRSKNHEFQRIHEVVAKYALAYADIRFELFHNNQAVLISNALTTEERFIHYYGKDLLGEVLHIPLQVFSGTAYKVEAWLANAEHHFGTRREETFFVNGRLIQDLTLSQIVEEAYEGFLAKGRFPICLLKITMPTDAVDVNIHPAKERIHMSEIRSWREELMHVLRKALLQTPIEKVPHMQGKSLSKNAPISTQDAVVDDPVQSNFDDLDVRPMPLNEKRSFDSSSVLVNTHENRASSIASTQAFHVAEPKQIYSYTYASQPTEKAELSPIQIVEKEEVDREAIRIPQELVAVDRIKNLKNLRIIGQLHNTFILAENEEGLFIIDQHTCHERVLFEKYRNLYNQSERLAQPLLIPLHLTLTPSEIDVLVEHIFLLKDLGFTLKQDTPNSFSILTIPKGWSHLTELDVFFHDLLQRLSEKIIHTPSDLIDACITTASCKDAVKANWKLTEEDMQYLLAALHTIDNAHSCPHGRPIIYKISMQALYKIFERGSYPYGKI